MQAPVNLTEEQLSDPRYAAAKDAGESAFEALVAEPARRKTRLPEHVFVSTFLPYFCGELDIKKDPNILINWIAIAGAPTKEVVIVTDGDEELFHVPPMSDTSTIDVTALMAGGDNFKDIMSHFMLYQQQLPIKGEQYLSRVMPAQMERLRTESTQFTANEQRWKEIFVRYGKMPPEAIAPGVDPAKGNIGEDEMDFGESL